jgi:hypothetical protein
MEGMGAMGVHYANGALVDGKIPGQAPEALVYRFTGTGTCASRDWSTGHRASWRATTRRGRPSVSGTGSTSRWGNRFGLPAYFSLHAGCGTRTRRDVPDVSTEGACPAGI